ncbi:YqcC family protein [Carnimonas nigrificans]|uniref:YqcC family protein n=1 Tax=Carnimonas nigrificans TaxID=64323 RepID=UPI00046F4580|nr:YqcC family protein [Carnimonas nigrificans]
MSQRTELSEALTRLEAAMRAAGIWKEEVPTPEAFASREPFSLDTMSLPQWLRYVFIARLRVMLSEGQPLPVSSSIAPAAQVYLPQLSEGARMPVVQTLQEIDDLISGTNTGAPSLH